MADRKAYMGQGLDVYGSDYPKYVDAKTLGAVNPRFRNWQPNDNQTVDGQKPYQISFLDTSNGRLNNANVNDFVGYKSSDMTNPWSQLQRNVSAQISDQVIQHGFVEVNADMSSRFGIVVARAVSNVKFKLGRQAHKQLMDPNSDTYDESYADAFKSAVDQARQTGGEDAARSVRQGWLMHEGSRYIRLVGHERIVDHNNPDNPFYVEEAIRGMHDSVLPYADEVSVSTNDVNVIKDPAFNLRYYEDVVNGSDEALTVGEQSSTMIKMVNAMTDEHVTVMPDGNYDFEHYQRPTAPVVDESKRSDAETPETFYLQPSKAPMYYVEHLEKGYKPTNAWRKAKADDASPVSVDEFMKALAPSLVNKNHGYALKSALNNDPGMYETLEVAYLDKNKVKPNNHPSTIRVVGRTYGGKHYYLSPSDVQTSKAIIDVLRDAHIDYDVVSDARSHAVDLKLKDKTGTKIRLVDPLHPYLVGRVAMADGMSWEPEMGRLTYSYGPGSTDSIFNMYYNSPDGHSWRPLSPTYETKGKNGSRYINYRVQAAQAENSIGHGTKLSNLYPEDQSIELNRQKYASLDQRMKSRIAVMGITNLLGIDKRTLPDYMNDYVKDVDGNTVYQDGQPVVNPNGFVFDDSQSQVQTIDGIAATSYERRINGGSKVHGSFVPLRIISQPVINDDGEREMSSTSQNEFVGDADFDFTNVYSGVDTSFKRGVGKLAVYDPAKVDHPNEVINHAYRDARARYLILLTGVERANDSKAYQAAQAQFKEILSDTRRRPVVVDDFGSVKKLRPETALDVESQKLVLAQFKDGIFNATFNDDGVDDATLIKNRQAIYDSVDAIVDKRERADLRARRLSAYDGLVAQMNDTFGTAPLLNQNMPDTNLSLSPEDYRASYAKSLHYTTHQDESLQAFDHDQKAVADVFAKYAHEIPSFKPLIDKYGDKIIEDGAQRFTYTQQRQLLDTIPHDTSTDDGQLFRQDHQTALDQFDQARETVFKKYAFGKNLNMTQVIANTVDGNSSVQYSNYMAQVAGSSKYAHNLSGDTEQGSFQVQENGVLYNPKTGRSIDELAAADTDPNSMTAKVYNYLDHVRGFKYVDANGNRVLDRDADRDDVIKQKVEPQVHFNWKQSTDLNDPTQNPMPQAFAGAGTSGADYHPDQIHLINEVSPNQYLIDRLKTVQTTLEQAGVKVSDGDIKVDDKGVIHYDARVPLYAKGTNDIKTSQLGYLTYDQYQEGLKHQPPLFYVPKDSKVINVGGMAVQEGSKTVMRGDLSKLGPDVDQRHYQPINSSFGQVFAPDFDGILRTRYNRFEGLDPKAGQKSYIANYMGYFVNPEQDANGNWSLDAMQREHASSYDHYARFRLQGLAQIMDRRIKSSVINTMSTPDLGDISNPVSGTVLNKAYRGEMANTKVAPELEEEPVSQIRQTRIENEGRRIKLDDAIGNATNTTSEIQKMKTNAEQFKQRLQDAQGMDFGYHAFLKDLDPKDPERTKKIHQYFEANADELIIENQDPFDAYGSANIAELSHPHTAPFTASDNTGQSGANGGVQFLVNGAKVHASSRVSPAVERYQRDHYDKDNNLIHKKGDAVLDQDGHPIPTMEGTPIDNTEANDFAYKNAADRAPIAKDQYGKGFHRINDAKVASMSLGAWTMEDGMVVSEDFANKYLVADAEDENGQPLRDKDGKLVRRPLKIGDKISDNGGNKATIATIIPNLPDDTKDRPAFYQKLADEHLLDAFELFNQQKQAGHPIDAVMGPMSQISRNNGATTATYLNSHDAKFAVQVKTADGYEDLKNEAGNVDLLSYDDAMKFSDDHPDAMFSVFKKDGNHSYSRDQTVDDDNYAHPIYANAAQVKHLAEDNQPMEFVRRVKDKDGNYVPHMIKNDQGEMVPDVVKTGSTLNIGRLTVTDQLVGHKVSRYDRPGAGKGRKMSFLVNVSDNSKGAQALGNFHFKNDDELLKLRAGLLSMGTDIDVDNDTKFVAMDDQRYDDLADETSLIKYQIPDDDMQRVMGVLNPPSKKRNAAPGELSQFVENTGEAIQFGTHGNMLSNTTNKDALKFTGYQIDPDASGDDTGKQLQFTSESENFIQAMNRGLNRSGVITNDSSLSGEQKYDAGSDFLNQLSDGGVLNLPHGLEYEDANGNTSRNLFILPERMRKNMVSTDGQTITSNMNMQYQRLGKSLARFEVLNKTAHDTGMIDDNHPEQQQAFNRYVSKLVGLDGAINGIANESNRMVLGGSKPKNGMFKNDVLGGYGGKNSITSQLGSNPALPVNVIEVSPAIAKTLGFVKDDPNSSTSFAHMKDKNGDHPDWDHVHVHRDPVWREQGSLGFKLKINDDLSNVRVNPGMVSLMDGDFDGDNVGLISMPDAKLQKELKNSASVDRWMMDNNGNNSLLNMDEDITDNAARVNSEYEVTGKDGHNFSGRINDFDFQKRVLENLDPQVLSENEKQIFDENQHIKPEFLEHDSKGNPTKAFTDAGDVKFPFKDQASILAKMTDSEIKTRYNPADNKETVANFIEAASEKDYHLDRDRVSLTVPGRNPKNGLQDPTQKPKELDGNFHDPQFQAKALHFMDNDVANEKDYVTKQSIPQAWIDDPKLNDDGSNYPLEKNQYLKDNKLMTVNISDQDFLKLLIRNESKSDPNFKFDTKPVETRLDDHNDKNSDVANDLHASASLNYQDARQKVDEILQRSLGYDTQRDVKTGEIATTPSATSNLKNDGVNYDSEKTCYVGLMRYANIGAKGSQGKVEGLMGTFNPDTGQFEGGYLHKPTHKELAQAAKEVLDPKTDELNLQALSRFKQMDTDVRDTQRSVQRALKIKTDMTSIPGTIQKKLTAAMALGTQSDLHAANAIGQAGTQKVLGIKREPIIAGYIAETLQEPVNEVLQGKMPKSSPLFALIGSERDGQLGSNPTVVSELSETLKQMQAPNGDKKLSQVSDDITDPKKFSTEDMIKIGSDIGIELKPEVDQKTGAVSDSKQIENFRSTVSRATQPYVREDFREKMKKKNIQYSVMDGNTETLTRQGFVEVLDYLYNDKEHGMDLGVDRKNFERLADRLTQPSDDPSQPDTILPIDDAIKTNVENSAPLALRVGENGYSSIRSELNSQQASPAKSESVMGAEGSYTRWMYFSDFSNDELKNKFSFKGRTFGTENAYDKIYAANKQPSAIESAQIARDDVHLDGRRRLDALVLNSATADQWKLKDDDKVIIEQENGSHLALNVKVDDNAKANITMSKPLMDAMQGDTFTLKAPLDKTSQKRLTDFTESVMTSVDDVNAYQKGENSYREASLQDSMLQDFNHDSKNELRDRRFQESQAQATTTPVLTENPEMDSAANLASLDALINNSQHAVEERVRTVVEDAYGDSSASDPFPDAASQRQGSQSSRPATSQTVDDHRFDASAETKPSADQDTVDSSNDQPSSNQPSQTRDNSQVDATPKPKPQPRSGQMDPNRLEMIAKGDDWNRTAGGTTVNVQVANDYYKKALQDPQMHVSKATHDLYYKLNHDQANYNHTDVSKGMYAIRKEYGDQTGQSLMNRKDSAQFLQQAYFDRMAQSPNYAQDLQTVYNQKQIRNRQKLTVREQAMGNAIDAYNRQFHPKDPNPAAGKQKPQSDKAKDKEGADLFK